jgi:hypothetical protein
MHGTGRLTTAWTTYARSLPAATRSARFSVSVAQISLIQERINGPAPSCESSQRRVLDAMVSGESR